MSNTQQGTQIVYLSKIKNIILSVRKLLFIFIAYFLDKYIKQAY